MLQGNREQALDILKSGLNFHQTGSEASRLYLAQAEIQADSGNWVRFYSLSTVDHRKLAV